MTDPKKKKGRTNALETVTENKVTSLVTLGPNQGFLTGDQKVSADFDKDKVKGTGNTQA